MGMHDLLLAAGPHRYYPLGATGVGVDQFQDAAKLGGIAVTEGGAVLGNIGGRNAVILDGVDDVIQIPSFWGGQMDVEAPMAVIMMVYVSNADQFFAGMKTLFNFSADAPRDWYSDSVHLTLGPYNSNQGFEMASMAKNGRGYGCYLRGKPLFVAGRWVMLTFQFQGNVDRGKVVRQVWVDGALWYDDPVSVNYISMPSAAMIGRVGSGNNSSFLSGGVYALAIYQRLLRVDEIIGLAQAADVYRPFLSDGYLLGSNAVIPRKLEGVVWDASYDATQFKDAPFVMGTPGVVDLPSGTKRLAGMLKRDGLAAQIPYRVYRRSDGALIKTGVSEADGTYSVVGLPDVPCYLIALDPQDEFNAGVLDRLQPET